MRAVGKNVRSAISGLLPVLLMLAGFNPLTFSQPSRQGEPEKSSTNFDGPAELPRIWIHSALADTPAPGKKIPVHSADDLQEAIESAQCGDTLMLEAGATFHGQFRFPAKPCDDGHWIIVRTDAPDDALPPEGKELTPCYAGVASLPGRPDFHCTSTRNVLARLELAGKTAIGPLVFMSGANHYRFLGLEVTRGEPASLVAALAIVREEQGTADHLIFDRVWMHGTAEDETTRGLTVRGMTYVAVVDSFFTDFHCVAATGACGDAQTISGGGGDKAQGPFKIVDNFLEASGENIMFGGGAADRHSYRHRDSAQPSLQASDLEARRARICGRRIRTSIHREESFRIEERPARVVRRKYFR